MSILHRTRRPLLPVLFAAAGATVAVHVAAAVGFTVADRFRKRREIGPGGFPTWRPVTAQVAGSSVTTYTYGEDVFTDMLREIRQARSTIYLESFIRKADDIGEQFKQAVIDAAERGVKVYLIYDGFANFVVPRSFYTFPPSIHVLRYPAFRKGLLMASLRHSGRDHRKILVVDSRVGFVGGFNLGSTYATQWRDTHVRVEGDAVWELEDAFTDFWNAFRGDMPELADRGARSWDAEITAACNVPKRMLFPVRGLYLTAINRAVSHIYITQGYFIPDYEILDALLHASQRGVDVRILMPERSNHVVADWVARGYYHELLEGGVTIWLYKDVMVHAKTMTVDGRWCTVGTANIDRLSLFGNYEVNLEIYSDEQADYMERIFHNDLNNCRQLTLEQWNRRGVGSRVGEWLLAPFHPLL